MAFLARFCRPPLAGGHPEPTRANAQITERRGTLTSFEERIGRLEAEAAERAGALARRDDEAAMAQRTIRSQASELAPQLRDAYQELWNLGLPAAGVKRRTFCGTSYSTKFRYTTTFKDPRPGRRGKLPVGRANFLQIDSQAKGSRVTAELTSDPMLDTPRESGRRKVAASSWQLVHHGGAFDP